MAVEQPAGLRSLRLDEDYYVEGGRCVLTASYLERRGWCCRNGCRHCPYRDRPGIEQDAALNAESDPLEP